MWKILIAEDSPEDQKVLLDGLKNLAECYVAVTGQEALDQYYKAIKTNIPFDFILLDITMPEMDGFEVLKAIRAYEAKLKESKQESFVIMVTAYRDTLMEKYNMGWDDFMIKPIDPKALIQKMKDLILSHV